ncbi:MAG: AAA family ATPase [Verrucomicrobia bacterium]|nr:AAA family ATPase [Verrucomicrobiota bacterium]
MRFAFMTPQHKEGLARLVYTAEERKPGAILTGDYGTGKSFLREAFLGQLSRVGDFVVATVDNPLGGIEAILTDIYDQIIDKPTAFTSFGAALRELRTALLARNARGFHSLVIIEEAQLLKDVAMLEQLRLMMNLQDDHGRPLVSLVFFGQLDVLRILGACRALSQRIPNRWTLDPLTVEQVRDYVTHRLSVAGGNAWIFDDDAVSAIHAHTGGIVRLINNIGDLSLYLGMSEQVVRIDASIVNRIVKDWELSRSVEAGESL